MEDIKGKKLLILAGADVHTKVVKAAKELGVYTIVTDYLSPEEAPAKQAADEYWMINITDINAIVEKCQEEKVDGVLAFCIDPAQIPYQRVCEKLGVPCYGTKEQFEILTNKRLFKDFCTAHGVDVIPEYTLEDAASDKIVYPVLVKPTDSRGSRGQTVCSSKANLPEAVKIAQNESKDGGVLIERYMLGKEDMSFAYIVIDGEPFLLKIGDRILGKAEDGLERQQIATVLPSRHTKQYCKHVEPNIKRMIKALGVKFGAIFLQGFWENGRVYMYDPGMRFPGSDFDVVMKHTTGFDNMKAFVRFALTGDIRSCYGNPESAYQLGGNVCMILSVSVRAGKISTFDGMENIAANPHVLSASYRHHKGDVIMATGDVKQRAAEFVAQLPNREAAKNFLQFVYNHLKIEDENGSDMIISKIEKKSI